MRKTQTRAGTTIRGIGLGKRWLFTVESGPPIIWIPRVGHWKDGLGRMWSAGFGWWIISLFKASQEGAHVGK